MIIILSLFRLPFAERSRQPQYWPSDHVDQYTDYAPYAIKSCHKYLHTNLLLEIMIQYCWTTKRMTPVMLEPVDRVKWIIIS